MNDFPEIEYVQLPTLTYRVVDGRIKGTVDGIEAMRQAVEKILLTTRQVVPWLSSQYGNDIDMLIGKSEAYVENEIERVLTEALMSDDRVTEVLDITSRSSGKNGLEIHASVNTQFGKIESEVMV